MEKEYYNQRLADYKEDLKDAEKSYNEAIKEVEEAIKWKYKQMEYLVEAHKKLQAHIEKNETDR